MEKRDEEKMEQKMEQKTILADIRQQLETHEHRMTPQREAVIRVLLQHRQSHLSAEDIYQNTKELFPEIGLATVYRSLELLEKLNIVYKLEYGDGQSRYELNHQSEEHYHHHLICLKCGAISEFNDDLLETIENKVASESNFKVTDHCLRFFGYCAVCQEDI